MPHDEDSDKKVYRMRLKAILAICSMNEKGGDLQENEEMMERQDFSRKMSLDSIREHDLNLSPN